MENRAPAIVMGFGRRPQERRCRGFGGRRPKAFTGADKDAVAGSIDRG
jgi:hypothetical protein